MAQEILLWGRQRPLYQQLEHLLAHEHLQILHFQDSGPIQTKLETGAYAVLLLEYRIASLRQVLALIRHIRSYQPHMHLIALAEPRHTVEDRIVALENGCDDMLGLDVDPRELAARIRRKKTKIYPNSMPASDPIYIFGDFQLDVFNRTLLYERKHPISLTWHEFELLSCLLENSGRAVSRETLSCRVHGRVWQYEERSLDVMLSIIRAKLRAAAPQQNFIYTIRGVGYHFRGFIKPVMREALLKTPKPDKS